MPAIPFLADAFRRLPGPLGQCQGSDEVAVCQLPFGQASDNAHLPNERLGIRQVEKVSGSKSSGVMHHCLASCVCLHPVLTSGTDGLTDFPFLMPSLMFVRVLTCLHVRSSLLRRDWRKVHRGL